MGEKKLKTVKRELFVTFPSIIIKKTTITYNNQPKQQKQKKERNILNYLFFYFFSCKKMWRVTFVVFVLFLFLQTKTTIHNTIKTKANAW